jgi:hypothetical protein
MRKLKTDHSYLGHFNTPMDTDYKETHTVISTITYNPISAINSEEYAEASLRQKEIYLRSKCQEAEIIITALSKMFEGDILNMEIEGLDFSIACILKTNKPLSSKEISHILSLSKNLHIS